MCFEFVGKEKKSFKSIEAWKWKVLLQSPTPAHSRVSNYSRLLEALCSSVPSTSKDERINSLIHFKVFFSLLIFQFVPLPLTLTLNTNECCLQSPHEYLYTGKIPKPSFLQPEQFQLFQSLLIYQMLRYLDHFSGLASMKYGIIKVIRGMTQPQNLPTHMWKTINTFYLSKKCLYEIWLAVDYESVNIFLCSWFLGLFHPKKNINLFYIYIILTVKTNNSITVPRSGYTFAT